MTVRTAPAIGDTTAFSLLAAISLSHLLNDLLQSLLQSLYPLLKPAFHLDFVQVGVITLTFQVTASVLQPVIGHFADRQTRSPMLPASMGFMLAGILLLAYAPSYPVLLAAAMLIGFGSSVFHPEASRVARMASGRRPGFAQSFFQVGGTCGGALGPLVAAYLVVPYGQASLAWFALLTLPAMALLTQVGRWHGRRAASLVRAGRTAATRPALPPRRVAAALAILLLLIFSKFFYLAGIGSYFTFYLIDRFQLSVQSAQLHLFAFSAASAAGTFFGGPLGDRFGRKTVIWASILGVLPFSLALPYADLFWTGVLSVVIGVTISAAFTAIIVFGQELLPNRVATISGLFFGFAFGMAGIGAAVLGALADVTSIDFVYRLCAFLPALGLFTAFLPDLESARFRPAPGPG